MPFDKCDCCDNLYGLDGDDLTMIHKGPMGRNYIDGRPVETRVTLTARAARELIHDLMRRFDISTSQLKDKISL